MYEDGLKSLFSSFVNEYCPPKPKYTASVLIANTGIATSKTNEITNNIFFILSP